MKKPRILIADDHALVLEGIRKLLETEVDLVGSARDGRELVSEACRLRPDIVLLDISMPLLNGLEAARQLRKLLPGTKLIFMTMHGDPEFVADAIRLGGSGYVLKSSAISELMKAIREALNGRIYVTPLVTQSSSAFNHQGQAQDLTPRQREVLQLMSEGRCPKEISSLLGISPRTVEFHKYSIMRKLGLNSVAELTKYAVRHHLTEA